MALVLCAALAACSFAGARSTPSRDREGRYRCASYLLPTGDLLVLTPAAGVGTVGTWVGYALTRRDQEPSRLPYIALGLATIAALSSSLYGYASIHSCHGRLRELEPAEAERAARRLRRGRAAAGYGPTPRPARRE